MFSLVVYVLFLFVGFGFGFGFGFWIYLRYQQSKNKLVKEFSQQCESFDKEYVINKLNHCYEIDKILHLRAPNKIKYVARKHGLPNDKYFPIYQDLINKKIDNNTKLLLVQAIKYSIKKKDVDIAFEKLVEILQKNQDTDIRSEMIWILGYQIHNSSSKDSKEQIDINLVDQIKDILEKTENQLNIDAINFLHQQIHFNCKNHQNDLSKLRIPIDYLRKSMKTIVTKTQQTVKIEHKNYESVESKNQSNSVMFLMNSHKKIEIKSNRERLPTVPDEDGSDTSISRATYREVIFLYNRMKIGQVVKKDDKDIYLPSKLLGPNKKWYLNHPIETLFIDRMIVEIFLEISKKQMLHEAAIRILMKCIDRLDRLEVKIFGHTDATIEIVNYIVKNKTSNDIKSYENDPKVIADIACKIYDENNFDAGEIYEIVTSEIKNIRIVAISTIYNCAMRNNQILNHERLEDIQRLLREDNDIDFKNWIINLLKDTADSTNIDKRALFQICLNQLEQTNKDNNSIDYIYQQSKDDNQFQLFNTNTISRIIRLLERSILTEKTKMIICVIINNYLERSNGRTLNENELKIYSNLINNSEYSEDLKTEALKSLIFTVEKKQPLPNFLIENLVENLHKGNEKFDNIIILVLGYISERQIISQMDKLTIKLLDDSIVVREGTEICFERKTNYTNDDQTISSIVASIILKSLTMNIIINDQSLQYLVEALNSHDKQTCILSAKALRIATETHEINDDILIELKEYVDSKIHDVSVYSTIAFSHGLAKLSSANKPILTSHIQMLPKIYVFDDLKLDEESFAETVNENILVVLKNEAKHKEFDEETFQIFNHLLSFENNYQKRTIEILQEYAKNKYLIPKKTIFALENCIDISELSEQILEIFQNIIYNKQIVNEKILNIFADNLYLSEDNRVRNRSFRLLTQADCNQDISDQLFDLLELEKASFSISTSSPDAYDALLYLCKKTKEGQKLTINCFRALTDAFEKLFILDEILKILLNISANGQIIPNELVEKIVQIFDPNEKQIYFIEIFENLVRNNQEISNKLLLKLEQALENKHYVDQLLLIFVFLGQKGLKVSRKTLFKIFDQFPKINCSLVIQQYLSFICLVLEKKDYFQYNSEYCILISHLQIVLVHSVKTKHQEIIRKAVRGFQILLLAHKIELDEKSLEALLYLLTNNICDTNIQEQIHMILNSSKLDENQKSILRLLSLNHQSNDQFLNQLIESDQPKLLENNFQQINFIIDNCPNLISQALKIVRKCSNKQDIPEKLFNSMIVLLLSTNSKEIKLLCCEIIVQTRQFNHEILSTISDQDDKDGSIINSILGNILIPKEIRGRIDLFLKSFDSANVQEFINEIQEKLKKDIQLSNQCIEQLFSIDIHPQIEQQLIDIYALILIQHPDCLIQDKIVENIEKSILSERISLNILNAYKEIIRRTKCQSKNFENVFQFFIKILNRNNQYVQFHFDIFLCIALASETTNVSNLEPLEINLFHENEFVRHWSFRGLGAAYKRDLKSIIFEQWCENIMKKFEEELLVQMNFDLDLFETIAILKYIDYNKIRKISQDQWIRELVIFDLIERFEISAGERLKFYQIWLEIEEEKFFLKDQNDILLKLIHRSCIHNKISVSYCFQMIQILKNIDFQYASNILLNSKNPLRDLQKMYLTKMIQQRLVNQTEISTTYVDSLALNMIDKFPFDISEKLLNALENLDNLLEFQNILTFAEENHIQISDIYVKDATITILKRSLEIKFLGNKIKETDPFRLSTCVDNLLDNHWTFQQLNEILNTCKLSQNRKDERYFLEIITMLSDYKLNPTEENQNRILSILRQPIENWIREINRIIVGRIFTRIGQVKNTAELIEEFKTNNSNNMYIKQLADGNLSSWIEMIKSSNLTSLVLQLSLPIARWGVDCIQQWAEYVKSEVKKTNSIWTFSEDFIVEACAVTRRANYLFTGYYLTDPQILSCLIALHTTSDQGRLLQVETGGGKTTIISILAIIHTLRGNNVDIITSSPVLAERDSIKQRKFYHMFKLECSHNNEKSIYLTGPKPCYKKQIVYGEVGQFQFDTLRTEYAQLNTLAGRKCQVAIVDEVDNMLIDDSSKIARLATVIPGTDQLQIIYHFLWHQLITFQKKIINIDDKIYLFYGKIGFEKEIMFLEYVNEEGTIVKISNLKNYISSTTDMSHIGKLISHNDQIDVFLKTQLGSYIKKLLGEKIKIAKNFKSFVHRQIPKWIDNAIAAYNYQENVHYVVRDGLIMPVDYFSTGIVQSSSTWSDGLHQFLQIKHNLKMTSETCTTNFLSNKGYFTRYGSNLFGLTGTLGSQKAKGVLALVYKVDLVLIPNLYQKQYRSLSDIVTINEMGWLKKICRSAITESNKGRGTLIICETIEHSQVIGEKLRRDYRSSAIKLYTMNNMNQEKNVEIIHSGEIIIATNLAGRGTDIKTDEIEEYGGLHVIVTFMPSNKRVEEQAFGRTARQGKRGTGQKILNAADLIHYENFDIQKISDLRDKMEADMLNKFAGKELELISLKDELFSKFCSLLSQIRGKIREKNGFIAQTTNQIKKAFKHMMPSVFESNLLMSIEEQWAMFLREIDDLEFPINKHQIYQKYETFCEKILEDYENDCVIKSPYYHINIGNDLIINDSSINSKYDRAMEHFNRAIELDSDHCVAAFVGKGWLLLKGKKAFLQSNQHKSTYKQAAIESFHRALQILTEEMDQLILIQTLLQDRFSSINTALSKQLIQKAIILGRYFESIQSTITVIKKSRRLIQIKEISHNTNMLRQIRNRGELSQIILYDGIEKERGRPCDIRLILDNQLSEHKYAIENTKEVGIIKKDETKFLIAYMRKNPNRLATFIVNDQTLKDYLVDLNYNEAILNRDNYLHIYNLVYREIISNKGCIERNYSKFLRNLRSNREYQITFNDLTVRKDVSTIDQAIQTIDCITPEIEKDSLSHGFNENIRVSINQINGKTFKDFINPNIEIEETTKEEALSQLRDRSSFFHRHLLPECLSPDSCPVDLEILFSNMQPDKKEDLQTKEAIDIIQNQTQDSLHYNLTFKSANQISTILEEKVLSKSSQNVEFFGLNAENIQKKIAEIQSSSINLELTDTSEKLIEVLPLLEAILVELDSEKNEGETYNRKIVDNSTAKRLIQNMTSNSLTIKLLGLNTDVVIKIINKCPNATYNMNFINVDFTSLLRGLTDELISIHFDKLSKDVAKILIEQIRIAKFDFNLTFKNLKNHQLSKIVELAPIKQENIEINKNKSLSDLFMNELTPHLELSEFSARGIEYLLEISERKFVPWRSISCVVVIASVQMAIGAALVTTGFGATVGSGLMTEAGADYFTAFRAYSTREFTLADYGKQKAVSLAISAGSMGFSSIKDAGKGIQNMMTGIRQEILEQAGTIAITNGKSMGQVLVQSTANLKPLVGKQIGVTIGRNVLRECLNTVADISSNLIMEQFKPQISASIQNKVNEKFSQLNLWRIVRKMYAIDLVNKNQQFKQKINRIIIEIINPENSFFRKQWNSIGGPLCKGILSNVDRIRNPASMGIRILGTLNGMFEITFIVDNIHKQLLKKLSQTDQETLFMENILYKYCQVEKENIDQILRIFRQQEIIDLNEGLDDPNFAAKIAGVDFSGFQGYKNKVTSFLTSLHRTMWNVEFNDFSEIMRLVSDMITEQIFRIVESQLISPLTTYGMGELTNTISDVVEDRFIVDEKQNSHSQNQEIQKQGKKGYNTIEKQIKYNARDNTIAYSQCEIIHYSQQKNMTRSGIMDQYTKDYVKNIRKDQPSSMSDMIAMASERNLDLKLVDDPNYKHTDEDNTKGTIIVTYSDELDREGKNSIKRFQLMSNDGTIVNIPSESNNSGYAVIQKLLTDRNIDISIEDLRNNRAQMIENNPQQFSYALKAQRWIETRYPREANTLLMRCSSTNETKSRLLVLDNTHIDIPEPSASFLSIITSTIRDKIFNYVCNYISTRTQTDKSSRMFVIVILLILTFILLERCWYWFCFG